MPGSASSESRCRVLHLKRHPWTAPLESKCDGASLGSELQGVADEVQEHLADAPLVANDAESIFALRSVIVTPLWMALSLISALTSRSVEARHTGSSRAQAHPFRRQKDRAGH